MRNLLGALRMCFSAFLFFLALGGFLSLNISNTYGGEARQVFLGQGGEYQAHAQYNLIKAVQGKLKEKGYDPGFVDGINGPLTQKALKAFQKEQGLIMDGKPGKETLEKLGLR